MRAEAGGGGRIVVMGRANTGKSTLTNALLGEHLHIVTHKPQTTRSVAASQTVLQEASEADASATQVTLVDTPGLHRHKGQSNRLMNRAALGQTEGASLILAVFDRLLHKRDDDYLVHRCREQQGTPCIAVINKVDLLTDKMRLLPRIEALDSIGVFAHVVPVSARKGHNLDTLRLVLRQTLAEVAAAGTPAASPMLEGGEKPDTFFAAETIREQMLLRYRQEVPHQVQVEIERFERTEEQLAVKALIRVSRQGQKGILLGAGGERLGKLREAAQQALAERFSLPVRLRLHIVVGRLAPEREF